MLAEGGGWWGGSDSFCYNKSCHFPLCCGQRCRDERSSCWSQLHRQNLPPNLLLLSLSQCLPPASVASSCEAVSCSFSIVLDSLLLHSKIPRQFHIVNIYILSEQKSLFLNRKLRRCAKVLKRWKISSSLHMIAWMLRDKKLIMQSYLFRNYTNSCSKSVTFWQLIYFSIWQ